ncbi:LuxR family transcriptional regulator [Kitasatospora sp. NPDC002227]|uniref:LuxR family transcriptional regulator n=1 Tax=Kitasatospora sp. NPDC002227 TaxID=3154773 RepID=UPI003323B1C3
MSELLPDAAERAFYLAVVEQGGRVLFRDVPGPELPLALRLVEIGLLVHRPADESLEAVDPRVAGDRIGVELRSAGARLVAQAEEVPEWLKELAYRFDESACAGARAGAVHHPSGVEEVRHRMLQIEAELKYEVLVAWPAGGAVRPELDLSLARVERFLREGGVGRTIHGPEARADAEVVRWAATVSGWGQQVRVHGGSFNPVRVFDRRLAVIAAEGGSTGVAFVADQAVVAFLVGVFERDWAWAEPVRWSAPDADDRIAPVHEQVGRLLAQGLTQRAVSSRLGLSERTVAGHIARLRELYDAETLFQLGWVMRGE